MVRRSRGFLGPLCLWGAAARSGEARRGVGRPPPGLRPAAGTDARRRNKSKVWTRKTHDALRAAGFRAAQLRDRLEWVDAQRRSGREHGEEARQRSHRKGTSPGHYCSSWLRKTKFFKSSRRGRSGAICFESPRDRRPLRTPACASKKLWSRVPKHRVVPASGPARLRTRSAVPGSPGERERVAPGPEPEPTRCRPPRRPPPRRELTSRELQGSWTPRRPKIVDQPSRRCSFGTARRRAAHHDREMVLTSREGGRRRRMAS